MASRACLPSRMDIIEFQTRKKTRMELFPSLKRELSIQTSNWRRVRVLGIRPQSCLLLELDLGAALSLSSCASGLSFCSQDGALLRRIECEGSPVDSFVDALIVRVFEELC